ncbi:MAG: PHP-associated domain-containing protein [archaeon]
MPSKAKPILADMHTHLNEKKIKPQDWWKAAKQKKLAVIAITEHAEYKPKEAYEKLARIKHKGIILIPGIEAKTTAGHLVVYGKDSSIYSVKELLKINVPIEKALAAAKKHNLVASFAHPYGYKTDSTCEILGEKKSKQLVKKYGAGAEYYNGMLGSANSLVFETNWINKMYNLFDFLENNKVAKVTLVSKPSRNLKKRLEDLSLETLERVRKGIIFGQSTSFITAGSDAHYPRTIGTAIVELEKTPRNEEDFLRMIKNREIKWAGPNIYRSKPVDKMKNKELFEGLKYMTQKRVFKSIRKPHIAKKINRKIPKIGKKLLKKFPGKGIVKKVKKKLWSK